MADPDVRPVVIDEVTLICQGCRGERKFRLVPHLHGAEEVHQWLRKNATRCPTPGCLAAACDAKMHMVDLS